MSGAATVGRLVVSVSGDVDQLKIDMREAQAITGAATKDIVNGLQGITDATYTRNAAGQRMVAALQQELDTFGMSTDEINIHKASLAGVGEQYSSMISRLNDMKASQAAFTNQMAASEAAATQRIRDMVAASAAESDAMRSATAATQGASAAMAQMTGVSRNWSDAQRLAAQNMAGVGASMRAAQGDTAAMSVETQKILDKYDPLGTKLRSLEAEFANLRKAMGNSVDPAAIKAFQGLEDEITRTKGLMATAGAEGFGKLEDGAKKSAFATAGATRELIVLGHEALTGNFSRMPGSAMVLAERMGGLASFITPVTVGILAVGVAAAAFGVAVYRGADESDKFAKSLALTGNFAAITEGQFNSMARTMADSASVGIGQGREALQSLVSTGQFTGAALASVGAAALSMSRMTGQSADEVVAEFAKMADGVVKWVDEHDKQYHFLSTSQYQHIRELAESGRAQEAMAETGKLVDEALKKNAENLGYLRTALKSGKEAWHDFWDAAEKVGRTATPEDRIAKAQADIVTARTTGMNPTGHTRNGGMNQADMDAFIQQQSNIIVAAIKDKDAAEAKATAEGEKTRVSAEGKQAVREVADMRKRYQDRAAAEKAEIKAYTDNMAKIAADGGKVDSGAEQARMIADIHKNYESRAAAGADASKAILNGQLADDKAAAAAAKASYDQLDKLADLYHKGGVFSDSEFYAAKRANFEASSSAEHASFEIQLAQLRAFQGKTAAARQENLNKIKEVENAKAKVDQDYADKMQILDAEEMLRQKAVGDASDHAMNKYLEGLDKEAEKLEKANAGREDSKGAVERNTVAVLDSAIAYQQEFMAKQAANGATAEEIAQAPVILKYLQDMRGEHERIAKALDQADVDAANQKAAAEASKSWKHAATTIENDLTNAILDGGGKGWKKLVHDMEFAFARMILSPILQPISGGIASYLNPLASQAQAGGAAGLSGAVGVASNAYSLFTGGMSLAGGLGTGFMGSVSGGLMGAGMGSGLTSATGLAIGNSIAGVVGPAAAGAISSGMTMVAAAMPWLAAAAIGGALLSKAFGHGDRQTTSSTLTGSFGANGFSGATNDAWKEAGGWFSSDRTGVTSNGVDSATAKQFGDGYKALQDASAQFAQALGVDASSVTTRSQSMSIALTSDANANKQAIADFFTGVGNSMATELVPNLADFAKAGEAASTTLQRLAGDFQATDQFAAMLGKSATQLFGAAGMGSAAAREHLLDASGGSAALGQKTAAYMQNFYNEADKIAPVIKTVGEAMDSLGLSSIKTKADFKAQIDGMLKTGLNDPASADLFANLMNLQGAFAQVADYADAAAKATLDKALADKQAADALAASAAKEQRGLDIQLMTALGNAEGALAATRQDSLDAMLSDQARLTQQQIWAADEAAAATAKAQASAAAQVAAQAASMQSFGDALVGAMNGATAAAKALRAFNDSLLLGNLSSLSKGAQYDVAKSAYMANGDQASATAFLQASQAKGGSRLDYARDFAMVIAKNSAAATARESAAAAIPSMWVAFQQSVSGLPAHANGGVASGWSIVGEKGPELANFTSPARIYTASQTQSMLGGGTAGLKEEIKQLRTELNAALQAIALNTSSSARHAQRTSDVLMRVTRDGNSLLTSAA